MGAKIQVKPEKAEPFEAAIENTATIGRTPENTICLSSSPHVSRQHAIIRCHNGYEYQLMDLGSRNGTFVNDQRVVMPVTLLNGAKIRIGPNEMVFQIDEHEAQNAEAEATLAATMDSQQSRVHPVAILVCDIRGFSTFSETLPAATMAQILGSWFRQCGNLVQKEGGIIDKFIGDALLAYWPRSGEEGEECKGALSVAKQFLELARKINWPESELPFRVGVVLHFGPVSSGNIGLVAQRDATIIGDTVNTAFRLEGIMKALGQDLLLSESFVDRMNDRANFEDLGEKALKGKSLPVRVFACRSPIV